MELIEKQKEKLELAKALLTELGLPKTQCNDRSGWVFLALANVKPTDEWGTASSPLLTTANMMAFIRNEYGMDYKPNSRETIRRSTLHQFEQARMIDRNRDDQARATNSKDNNYSLNQEILNIFAVYPNGDWEKKVQDFKGLVGDLTA